MTHSRTTTGNILVKNSFINLMGMVIPLLVGVAAIPFAIRGLGKDGFGILSIAWVILSYTVLLDLGLSRATTKFTSERLHQKHKKEIPTILWTAVLLGLGYGILGGAILYFTSPVLATSMLNIPTHYHTETIKVIRYISYGLPLLLISISLKGMLGAAQRFDLVNAVQIPINTLNFTVPAFSFFFGIKLSMIILIIVALRILACLMYFYLCSQIYPISLKKIELPNKYLFKKMLIFGGWVTITSVISPILVYIDRFFIGSILSISVLTFYAAPLEAITRLRIIPTAIMNTLFPEFSKSATDVSHERILILIKKSLNMILLIIGTLSIILFFYAKDILTLWLGNEFVLNSTTIFKLFSISILFNFMALVPFTYLQGADRPDIPAKFHLAELPVYIVAVWFFVHRFGITGAAYAWCLRVTVDAVLLFSFTFRDIPGLLKSFLSTIFIKIITLLFVFAVALFLVNNFITDLFSRIVILAFLTTLMTITIYFEILDNSERTLLLSIFKRRSA